jgi:hypothetical protein
VEEFPGTTAGAPLRGHLKRDVAVVADHLDADLNRFCGRLGSDHGPTIFSIASVL